MKKLIFFTLILCALFSTSAISQTTWMIDPQHSSVEFSVTHLAVSKVTGVFEDFSGSIVSKGKSFDNAQIKGTVQVATVNTRNITRDKHLREDDFFNAAEFPVMTFKSTSFTHEGSNKYILKGMLTIRDVSKPVNFEVQYNGQAQVGKDTRAAFEATGTINRFDFGLKWDDTFDSGGFVVSEDVEIKLNITATKN